MNRLGVFAVALSLATFTGCARRAAHGALPNLSIPVGCASEITLLRCDARVNPPRCESARVRYRGGCERILVGRR